MNLCFVGSLVYGDFSIKVIKGHSEITDKIDRQKCDLLNNLIQSQRRLIN
jgi:hypothetical protein